MGEIKKFSSNEECAVALYKYLISNSLITAKDPFVQENNVLHDINNLRGYEWLECLPRNAETEAFFAYLDPEYVPNLIGSKAENREAFIFDISIGPGEYWELATGESGVVITSLDALRTRLDDAGLGEVWDYPVSDIDEAVSNNDHVVFVDDGKTISYPHNDCRIFEVTDEMYERYEKMYGGSHKVFTWDDMKEKYPEYREDMSEEREKEFVNDCFELYEKEGFADKFWNVHGQYEDKAGQLFEVINRCSGDDFDLVCLPMWNIQFEDGTVICAYPEEIVPSEMIENGCPYFESLEDKLTSAASKSREVDIGKEVDIEFDKV